MLKDWKSFKITPKNLSSWLKANLNNRRVQSWVWKGSRRFFINKLRLRHKTLAWNWEESSKINRQHRFPEHQMMKATLQGGNSKVVLSTTTTTEPTPSTMKTTIMKIVKVRAIETSKTQVRKSIKSNLLPLAIKANWKTEIRATSIWKACHRNKGRKPNKCSWFRFWI